MRINLLGLWIILVLIVLMGSCAHDTDWLSRAEYDILAVDTDEDFFMIDGNHASEFRVEGEIQVIVSDDLGNPLTLGPFTVDEIAATLNGTRISIEGNVPDQDVVGGIMVHVSDANQEPDPEEIVIEFTTRGPFDPEVWYYMAFNFSQAAGSSLPSSGIPLDEISQERRAENWEMYVMIHQEEGGSTELSTLRTTRLPSVMPTGRGPVDTTTGQLTDDDLVDVAIACQLDNIVQVLPAFDPSEILIFEDIKYWENAVDVDNSAGPAGYAPIRVHVEDFTGDNIVDLLILYANESEGGGLLRILEGTTNFSNPDSLREFTYQAANDIPLDNTPVDWVAFDPGDFGILDLNDDTFADLVVLGATDTVGQVMVFSGLEGGGFSDPETVSTAAQPVAIAAGILTDGTIDFAVASNSGAGGNGAIQVLQAQAGAGHVSVKSLDLEGAVQNVAIARMFGSASDIVATFNTADQGHVAVFQNEESEFFTEAADVISYNGASYGILPIQSDADNWIDMVVTDGVPGQENHSMYVIHRDGSKPSSFTLDQDIITYLMGVSPGRIHLTDLDGDGLRDDFVIPNSFDGDGGNSVNLVYGQGNSNYTSADRYWVDFLPQQLTAQSWYKRHAIGPNSFSLVIDPLVFYDLTLTEIDSFIIDIMSANCAIDFNRNLVDGVKQQGEVWEHMSTPIKVNVQVDYLEDENNANRTLEEPSIAAQDIDFWKIEVI